jgi:hypothetical protein
MTNAALDHELAVKLLPWFVNGSLSSTERQSVELHARACVVCRREIKELHRLASAVREQPLVHLSSEGGLRRLEQQLDAETRRNRVWREQRIPAALRFAAAAGIGVALLGTLLWLAPQLQNKASYSTLATSPVGQPAEIDLIFAEQATTAEVQALLRSIDGEIVTGPSSLGRYGIRIRGARPSDEQLTALLDRLAHDPRVRFAGRSFTESTP